MVTRKGDSGDIVRAIQEVLDLRPDGIFGPKTEAAVKQFQSNNGLTVDGIVGPKTLAKLGLEPEDALSTDEEDWAFATDGGLTIQRSYLDPGQYRDGPTDKFYVFLHHTAGGHDPFRTVRNWSNDSRGRIATQFVVGGKSKGGDTSYDGVVVQCFPDGAWAYHLGKNRSPLLHPHSIGIEICNYGWLKRENGKFVTYVASTLPDDQVCDLGSEFRGHRYYHKYTDAQIDSVRKLLKEIALRHPAVDLTVGLPRWLKTQDPNTAFEYKEEADTGQVRGLLTHSNVRKHKSDCSPQPALVAMLKEF